MLKITNLVKHPQHLKHLADWHHKQWSYLYPDETIDDRINKMKEYLSDNFIPTTYISLENNHGTETLLGSAAVIKSDMETHPELSPWLASVYTHTPYRNRGVASTLISHVLKQARQNGFNIIYLFTPDQEEFYTRRGWSLHNREIYHNEKVSIMTYDLTKLGE